MTGEGLTIAELSAATGVGEATLRAWETRHGVPAPVRLPNGHRRYSGRDVQVIRAAVAHRREGMSVGAALRRAAASVAQPPPSLFAAVRERRPELVALAMGRAALTAVSRAIEDEAVARAAGGLLIGGFQRERFYRPVQARWRELAAAMQMTIVMADFRRSATPRRGPSEVAFGAHSPLTREWLLVAPCGCVLARERVGARRGEAGARVFDTIWSPEPEVVHLAARTALALGADEQLAARGAEILGPEPAPSPPELRHAAALTNRIIAYLP